MRIFLLLILLGFPALEFWLLFRLSEAHGWWVLAWVVLAACMGFALIREARFALVARLAVALAEGRYSIAALVDNARTVVAGLFLIFPGVISDFIALALLLLPHPRIAAEPIAVRGGTARTIDGQFRREH